MNIGQLEHIIRAAAVITEDDELIIIGSQSILGAHPNTPENLLVSAEADVYPKNHPERADPDQDTRHARRHGLVSAARRGLALARPRRILRRPAIGKGS